MSSSSTILTCLDNNISRWDKYRSKYVGLDMLMKTIGYLLRAKLIALTPGSQAHVDISKLLQSMVECRMLCNSMRHFGTLKTSFDQWRNSVPGSDVNSARVSFAIRIITLWSLWFRTVEQIFSDCAFWNKSMFLTRLSRATISYNYKKWKSLSLACCVVIESYKALKARGALLKLQSRADEIESRSMTPHADTGRSPVQQASPMHPSSRILSGFPCEQQQLQLHQQQQNMEKRSKLRTLLRRSIMFLIRNICDLIIYSQWIPGYVCPKSLEAFCGIISGAFGVYLVWEDTPAVAAKK